MTTSGLRCIRAWGNHPNEFGYVEPPGLTVTRLALDPNSLPRPFAPPEAPPEACGAERPVGRRDPEPAVRPRARGAALTPSPALPRLAPAAPPTPRTAPLRHGGQQSVQRGAVRRGAAARRAGAADRCTHASLAPSRATSTSMLAQEKPAAQAAASAKLGKALLLEAEDCPLELFEG